MVFAKQRRYVLLAFVSLMLVQIEASFAASPKLSVGGNHTCAIGYDKKLFCWGVNSSGQLGTGSTINSASPIEVAGLGAGVTNVSAGFTHTCAVTTAGAVKCWGTGTFGELGQGVAQSSNLPVDVVGLNSGVVAVAATGGYTCALLTSGGVKCWGNNGNGSLGSGGPAAPASSPVDVVGLSSGVTAIGVGYLTSCALLSTGAVKCWGGFAVGDGTSLARTTPVDVSGLSIGVVSLSVGSNGHRCVVKLEGTVFCWGGNSRGQLGVSSPTNTFSPNQVPGLTTAVSVSAGGLSTCSVLSDSTASCWGDNDDGKGGVGFESVSLSPTALAGFATGGVAEISVGAVHACLMTRGGSVRCWGKNAEGQAGTGELGGAIRPIAASALSANLAAIALGDRHACSLDTAGSVACWGDQTYGQTGSGTASIVNQIAPTAVNGLTQPARSVASGGNHSCALRASGEVVCWGLNLFGQLGNSTTTSSSAAVQVSGLPAVATSISAGSSHTCAVAAGGAFCWGYNNQGQLGNGTTSTVAQTTPTVVTGLSTGVLEISVGDAHSCALLSGGSVKCWGGGSFCQLATLSSCVNSSVPLDALPGPPGFFVIAKVIARGLSTCFLLQTGAVDCRGLVGIGLTTPGNVFTPDVALDVAVGGRFVCARLTGDVVKCAGWNNYGQLGDGTIENKAAAVAPVGGFSASVTSIVAANNTVCALRNASPNAVCWGDNSGGQLANGTTGFATIANQYVAMPSLVSPLAVSDSPSVTADRDGVLISRYLLGLTSNTLTDGLMSAQSLRSSSADASKYMARIRPLLDIDDDTEFKPTTDGLLVIRYLLGVRGDALVAGAIGLGARRSSFADVQQYLATLLP